MPTPATIQQLQHELTSIIERADLGRPITADIFRLLARTGLRIREVLETHRWDQQPDENFVVRLEKGSALRIIYLEQIPPALLVRFRNQWPFELETYAAVNNTFRRNSGRILFGANKRPTTLHSFRYAFIKQLHADGKSVEQIAEIVGHQNPSTTGSYILDPIYLGLRVF